MSSECDFAAISATTEDHKRLAPFAGSFKAEVKMWMGPGDPMVSTGRMVNTLDLGGRFLHQVYTGDPNDGPNGEPSGDAETVLVARGPVEGDELSTDAFCLLSGDLESIE